MTKDVDGQRPKEKTALFYWPDGEMRDVHLYKDVGEIPKTLHEIGYYVIVIVGRLRITSRPPWDRTYELGEAPLRARGPATVKLIHKIIYMNAFLFKVLLNERPDIIIIMYSDPRVLLVLAIYKYLIKKRVKIVNKLDSDGSFAHNIYKAMYYQLGTLLSDKVIIETTCAYEKVLSSKLLKYMSHKLVVVPNGVSNDILFSNVHRKREKRILFAGAITYEKGLDVLIRALFRIRQELNHWKVVIASNGADSRYQGLIKKYVELYGLEDKVEFVTASRAEMLDLYFSSSIFVLPTRRESYGIAIAEALASGLIVITTDGTCGRDFESFGAIVVKKDSVDELAFVLRHVIKNYENDLPTENDRSRLETIRKLLNWRFLTSLIIR